MARNAGDVLVKRNSKLESFLQKNLHEDTFQRIRCHEACIVCSDKEDKAYKFVVLTDDWIYLTENPPKRVQPIVHLGDVLSVELVNEFPDFLSGEERDSCQHVVIKYFTLPAKSKKKAEKEDGAAKSVTGRDFHRPMTPTTLRPGTPGSARPGTPNSAGGTTARSGGIMSARNAKHAREYRKTHLENGEDSDSLMVDRLVLDEDLLQDTDSSHSPQIKKDKKSGKQKLDGRVGQGNSVTSNLARTLRNRYSSSDYDRVRQRSRPLPNPADEWDENGQLTDTRRKEPLRLSYAQTGELHLSLDQLEDESEKDDQVFSSSNVLGRDHETTRRENSKIHKPINGTTGATEAKAHQKKPGEKRSIFSAFRRSGKKDEIKKQDEQVSEGSLEVGMDSEPEEEQLTRTALHLYILNYSSPVLMLTRTAWNNYLIRGTLMLDETYERKTTSLFTPRTARGQTASKYEKLGILFTQLTSELLNPENNMEDTFSLLHELKVATERNNALKQCFWKKPDVFLFLICQLQLYLPSPKKGLGAEYETAKGERADQFELVNMILETLALMLRETEVLPSRLQCLKNGKGKSVLDVIVMLTCEPWLPPQPDNEVAEEIPSPNNNNKKPSFSNSETWTTLADFDLRQLCEEFTDQSSRVLYELILIAHQANWGDTDGSFLNICWLIKLLDQLNTTESYVRVLVNSTLRHILPTLRREELTPDDAVLLFMQLSILQTLLEYSPTCKTFIQDNFYEEFKYYIQAPVILQKLPSYYPISPHAVRLIEEVVGSILHKRISLKLEDHYQQLF